MSEQVSTLVVVPAISDSAFTHLLKEIQNKRVREGRLKLLFVVQIASNYYRNVNHNYARTEKKLN